MHIQAYFILYIGIAWAVSAVYYQFLKLLAHTRATQGVPSRGTSLELGRPPLMRVHKGAEGSVQASFSWLSVEWLLAPPD